MILVFKATLEEIKLETFPNKLTPNFVSRKLSQNSFIISIIFNGLIFEKFLKTNILL